MYKELDVESIGKGFELYLYNSLLFLLHQLSQHRRV